MRFAAGVCSAWAFVSTSVWCLGALARLQRPSWGSAVYAGVGAGIAIAGLYCLAGGCRGPGRPARSGCSWAGWRCVLMLPVAVVLRRLDGRGLPAGRARRQSGRRAAGTTGLVVCYGVIGFGYILPATFLPVLARSVVDDPRLFGLAWPVFGADGGGCPPCVAGWCMRHFTRLQVWAWRTC